MTANQLQYWSLQEQKRSNRAKESEAVRSNTAKETEARRSNKVKEALQLAQLDPLEMALFYGASSEATKNELDNNYNSALKSVFSGFDLSRRDKSTSNGGGGGSFRGGR